MDLKSNGPQDVLLLHGRVLAAASDRFAARLNSAHWEPTREVQVAVTDGQEGDRSGQMKTNRVFEYHLSQIEDTFCLTDDKEASTRTTANPNCPNTELDGTVVDWLGNPVEPIYHEVLYSNFCSSSLVEGHQASRTHAFAPSNHSLYTQSVYEHKVLFHILYHSNCVLDLGTPAEALATLFDVTALADYYLLLSTLANQIAARIEAIPDVWKMISQDPEPYVMLAMKLRSHTIFEEAMRHLVGRSLEESSNSSSIFTRAGLPKKLRNLATRMRYATLDQAEGLRRQLRSIGLSWYQAHPEAETRRKRGPEVRTTWLAANPRKKTLEERCKWIAASIYREKLDQLMYGEEHWSHVEYIRSGRKNGDVEAGSLFITCKALMAANNSPQALDIFGKNAASKFASMFGLRRTAQDIPAAIISRELRRLVRSAVHAIQYWLPLPGAAPNQYAQASPAKYADVDYFTSVHVLGAPWEESEDQWEDFDPEVEAVAASREWLEAIGL